jgi:hypothetical protein
MWRDGALTIAAPTCADPHCESAHHTTTNSLRRSVVLPPATSRHTLQALPSRAVVRTSAAVRVLHRTWQVMHRHVRHSLSLLAAPVLRHRSQAVAAGRARTCPLSALAACTSASSVHHTRHTRAAAQRVDCGAISATISASSRVLACRTPSCCRHRRRDDATSIAHTLPSCRHTLRARTPHFTASHVLRARTQHTWRAISSTRRAPRRLATAVNVRTQTSHRVHHHRACVLRRYCLRLLNRVVVLNHFVCNVVVDGRVIRHRRRIGVSTRRCGRRTGIVVLCTASHDDNGNDCAQSQSAHTQRHQLRILSNMSSTAPATQPAMMAVCYTFPR